MSLVHVTNRAELMVEQLIQQYKGKPRLTAIISAIGSECQELEDALWQLLAERTIDTGIGAQLDVIGRIIGQKRHPTLNTDPQYRLQLKARIRINRSNGTTEDLYSVFDGIWMRVGGTMKIVWNDDAKQSVIFGGLGMDAATQQLFALFLHDAKAAGVGTQMIWQTADDAHTFTMDDANAPTSDADEGFGDATAPGGGGQLAGAMWV